MRRFAFIAALVAAVVLTFTTWAEPIPPMREAAPVVFVCRNGVAMSVWSAAYFNRLAAARGLRERAISRASIPSFTDVPLNMLVALGLDGFRLGGYRPNVVSATDVTNAELVVTIDDAGLPSEASAATGAKFEVWQGFPPMREEYFPARRALKEKVEQLVARLEAAGDGS